MGVGDIALFGRILKGVGGLYTVEAQGAFYPCNARGKFRKQGLTPTVGDMAHFEPGAVGDEGYLLEIAPRKSIIVRPAVANVDGVAIVMAAAAPAPDYALCDRLILHTTMAGISPCVVINKSDLAEDADKAAREDYEPAGISVYSVCAHTGEGLSHLAAAMVGEVWCMAGQSGVGKSSMANALLGAEMQTGSVSRIARGRHTTRHVELLPTPQGGYLVDTPGFSIMELPLINPEELAVGWPEFAKFANDCRFDGCAHMSEPSCRVKEAAQNGEISARRLERYQLLYKEAADAWSRRYN